MKKYVDNFMQYRFSSVRTGKKGIKLKYRRSYLGMNTWRLRWSRCLP